MSDPIRALESLRQQFEQDLASAGTEADLRTLRDKYLSRKGGLVSAWLKSLGTVPADERPHAAVTPLLGRGVVGLSLAVER